MDAKPSLNQSSIAGEHANADGKVDDQRFDEMVLRRYEVAFGEISVNQPEHGRHPDHDADRPDGRNGPLQSTVGKLGLVMILRPIRHEIRHFGDALRSQFHG